MIDYDHAPLGDVAFRATSPELYTSGTELRKIAMDCDDEDRVEIMLATAQWYEDLALDLAEIRDLPVTGESPFQVVAEILVDPDEDIPF